MPKSRKRTFKTKLGVLKRIYRRDLIWNQNRKNDFENQQSFERVRIKLNNYDLIKEEFSFSSLIC